MDLLLNHFSISCVLFVTLHILAVIDPCCASTSTTNFTIVNGQIYTPGLAIVDSPQPYTPEGGDYLQVAIDVSGDGRLPLPPHVPGFKTGLYNITLFLTSYLTGLNLTISNGTTSGWSNNSAESSFYHCTKRRQLFWKNAGCYEVLDQEPGSTVKHVNWVWPDCLVGEGGAEYGDCLGSHQPFNCVHGTARGPYNISIHQSFRLNGTAYYTIFDLPIEVTNSIPKRSQYAGKRPLCALRNNRLLSPAQQKKSTTPLPYQPWLGGNMSDTI